MEEPFSYNSVHVKEVRESLIVFFVWNPSCLFNICGIICWIIQAQKASLGLGKIKKKGILVFIYIWQRKWKIKTFIEKVWVARMQFKRIMRIS